MLYYLPLTFLCELNWGGAWGAGEKERKIWIEATQCQFYLTWSLLLLYA